MFKNVFELLQSETDRVEHANSYLITHEPTTRRTFCTLPATATCVAQLRGDLKITAKQITFCRQSPTAYTEQGCLNFII